MVVITNFLTSEVVLAIVSAIIGGISWLAKRFYDKVERKRQEEINERNKRRESIENRIEKLENDNIMFQSLILGCKKEDCPSRSLLAEYMKNKLNK